LVLVGLTTGACGTDIKQQKFSCPAGHVPRIVMVKQGSTATPTEAINEACPNWVKVADDGLIEDFEDDNSQVIKSAGRDGYWWMHHDPNGSTIEPDGFATEEGGAAGDDYAINIRGQTASSQGAYGSSLGVNFTASNTAYDASKYIGVRFKAKAAEDSTKSVRLKVADVNTHKDGGVCTDCWNHFGKDIKLSNEWDQYTVLFSELHQVPGWGQPRPSAVKTDELWGLDWTVGPGRKFDIWIDDVEFIVCQ
jgi:endoglucanase